MEKYNPENIFVPDEEDLTSAGNLLKFKDRGFNDSDYSGLGKKILRKNLIEGMNVLTESMISEENTIYVIQYDFDLRGATIEIPSNCVLKFEGGKLDNGVLCGNYTVIDAPAYQIFGDNLALFQYALHYRDEIRKIPYQVNSGVINPTKVYLDDALVTRNENVICRDIWFSDSKEAFYDKEEAGQSGTIDNTDLLTIGKFTILNDPMNSMCKLIFDDTGKGNYDSNMTLNKTTLLWLQLETDEEGNPIFIIPRLDQFLFFHADGTRWYADEVVTDLNDIYLTYLNRLKPDITSTFIGEAPLEWFGIELMSESDFRRNFTPGKDCSANIQKAFNCTLPIKVINPGFIRCENTLYIELGKRIDLGGKYTFPDTDYMQNGLGNVVYYNNDNVVFYSTAMNQPALIVRAGNVDLTGGGFTAEKNTAHADWLCKIDGNAPIRSGRLDTAFIGASTTSQGNKSNGILIDTGTKSRGYIMNMHFSGYIGNVIYGFYVPEYYSKGLYTKTSIILPWCTNLFIEDLFIDGFYQGITMYKGSMSKIDCILQGRNCVPIEVVDDYYHSYFDVNDCEIDMFCWDMNYFKTGAALQTPYKKIQVNNQNIITGKSLINSAYQFDFNASASDFMNHGTSGLIGVMGAYKLHHLKLDNILKTRLERASNVSGKIFENTNEILLDYPETSDEKEGISFASDVRDLKSMFTDTPIATPVKIAENQFVEIVLDFTDTPIDLSIEKLVFSYRNDSKSFFRKIDIIQFRNNEIKSFVKTFDVYNPVSTFSLVTGTVNRGISKLIIRLSDSSTYEDIYMAEIGGVGDINAPYISERGGTLYGDLIWKKGAPKNKDGTPTAHLHDALNSNVQTITLMNESISSKGMGTFARDFATGRIAVVNNINNKPTLVNIQDGTRFQRYTRGVSENRPNPAEYPVDMGTYFFDLTLKKPIWYNGDNTWVDAMGNNV